MSYLQFLENLSVKGGGKVDINSNTKLPKPKISIRGGKEKVKKETKEDNISIRYNLIKNIIDPYITS